MSRHPNQSVSVGISKMKDKMILSRSIGTARFGFRPAPGRDRATLNFQSPSNGIIKRSLQCRTCSTRRILSFPDAPPPGLVTYCPRQNKCAAPRSSPQTIASVSFGYPAFALYCSNTRRSISACRSMSPSTCSLMAHSSCIFYQ